MSHERKLNYLNRHRIIYRRLPINDTPDQENEVYMFYSNGTYEFMQLAEVICNKVNGFVSFAIHADLLRKIVYEVSMLDLETPPKNKLRKVIFKPFTRISKEEKLRIVGELIGLT